MDVNTTNLHRSDTPEYTKFSSATMEMEWSEGDLIWFDPNIGHPLPGEIQEVHRAAQVIIVQALINGKVSDNIDICSIFLFLYLNLFPIFLIF